MSTLQRQARWLFLFSLIEAPWAYGSTRPWTIEFLNSLLIASFLLNFPGFILGRFRDRHPLPFLPLLCLGLLIVETFWMWINARSYLDDTFWEFVPLSQLAPGLPGSWDRAATGFHLQSLIAFLAGSLVATDMVYDEDWRERLWLTMAGTGISVVLYGMIQHVFAAPSIFWLDEDTGVTFFGPFRYHGNAGAFLNLIWPILVFLLIRGFRRPRAYLDRAIWTSFLFLTLAACVINISRAAAAITILLMICSYFWIFPYANVRPVPLKLWKKFVMMGLFGVFVGALVVAGGRSLSEAHWTQLIAELNESNQRLLTYGACLRMIPEAGWFGFGSGTFSAVFPYHTQYLGNKIFGFWMYAHEDYLQTVIEYGYVGTLLWSLFYFSGLGIALIRAIRVKSADGTTDRLSYAACALALTGVALHSLVDFPLQVPSIQLYVMVFIMLAWRVPGSLKTSRQALVIEPVLTPSQPPDPVKSAPG